MSCKKFVEGFSPLILIKYTHLVITIRKWYYGYFLDEWLILGWKENDTMKMSIVFGLLGKYARSQSTNFLWNICTSAVFKPFERFLYKFT